MEVLRGRWHLFSCCFSSSFDVTLFSLRFSSFRKFFNDFFESLTYNNRLEYLVQKSVDLLHGSPHLHHAPLMKRRCNMFMPHVAEQVGHDGQHDTTSYAPASTYESIRLSLNNLYITLHLICILNSRSSASNINVLVMSNQL